MYIGESYRRASIVQTNDHSIKHTCYTHWGVLVNLVNILFSMIRSRIPECLPNKHDQQMPLLTLCVVELDFFPSCCSASYLRNDLKEHIKLETKILYHPYNAYSVGHWICLMLYDI